MHSRNNHGGYGRPILIEPRPGRVRLKPSAPVWTGIDPKDMPLLDGGF